MSAILFFLTVIKRGKKTSTKLWVNKYSIKSKGQSRMDNPWIWKTLSAIHKKDKQIYLNQINNILYEM